MVTLTNKIYIDIVVIFLVGKKKQRIKQTKISVHIITPGSTEDVYFVGRSENLKLGGRIENVICDQRKIS